MKYRTFQPQFHAGIKISPTVAKSLLIYHWRVLLAIAIPCRQHDHASWIADQILREVAAP